MVHRISGWILGYVKVQIPGEGAERFVNLCRNHGIYWWDLSWKQSGDAMEGCLGRRDFSHLSPIEEKVGVWPVILESHGGYYLMKKALGRASFWCGIACFMGVLFFLSGRIWGIALNGQSYHSRDSILKFLDSEGIYGGMSGKEVSCPQIEGMLRREYTDVGWASVEKSGSKLYIQLDEMIQAANPQKKKARNITADRKGEVVSIVTKTGTAKVRAGDRVKKGQVMISGKVKIYGDNEELLQSKRVRAEGTIVVRSVKRYRIKMPKMQEKQMLTGRFRSIYELQMGKESFFFYNPLKSLETFEKYDIIKEGGLVCPSLSLRFPLSFWKKTFREKIVSEEQLALEEAEAAMREQYEYYLYQLEESGLFDLSGELFVQEKDDYFLGRADITYSKQYGGTS